MNSEEIIDKYMPLLYSLAEKSYKYKEIPVGAIIIYNNKVIGKGYNTKESKKDILGHAEIMAIKQASRYFNDWRLNKVMLLTTLKPCLMCNEVIKASRIDKVYYILDQNNIIYDNNYIMLEMNDNLYFKKYQKLFSDFFKEIR